MLSWYQTFCVHYFYDPLLIFPRSNIFLIPVYFFRASWEFTKNSKFFHIIFYFVC